MGWFLCPLLCLLLSILSGANADCIRITSPYPGQYLGKLKDGKPWGLGYALYDSEFSYRGEWQNGIQNGRGELYWPDGRKYAGDFKDNKRQGKGTFYYKGGNIYDGDFIRDGQFHGNGTYRWKDGDVYVGSFINNTLSGFGVKNFSSGNSYEGYWENWKLHGHGTFRSKDGDVYVGSFINNTLSGFGVYNYSNGNSYEGYWENWTLHGNGTYKWKDGDVYFGSFINDKLSGFGVKNYSNGNSYEGYWEDGKKHGNGTYRWKDGDVYIGSFINDKPSFGVRFILEGNHYEGSFEDWKFHGHGTYRWKDGGNKNGDVYVGNFINDKLSGFGVYSYSSGNRYEGYFEDWKKHGNGTYRWKYGDVYHGEFQFDKEAGNGAFLYNPMATLAMYEGAFLNDQFHGQGVLFYKDGCKFNGTFQNGSISGEGILMYAVHKDKNAPFKYEGTFQNDSPRGAGKLFWKNGTTCSGEVRGNLCVGNRIDERGTKSKGSFDWKFDHTFHNFSYEHCGVGSTCAKGRIAGGTPSCFGQFPWMVNIRLKNGSEFNHVCGGSLIDKNWVLSAAHCFVGGSQSSELNNKDDYQMRFGIVDTWKKPFFQRKISKLVVHPNYKGTIHGFDFALLKLDQSIHFQHNIMPICLPSSGEDFEGQSGIVAGWGLAKQLDSMDNPHLPSTLQNASVPIQPHQTCSTILDQLTGLQMSDSLLCAGEEKADTCQGDSGGPLMVNNDAGKMVLVGITSFGGNQCGNSDVPGFYAKVSSVIGWIQQTIKDPLP